MGCCWRPPRCLRSRHSALLRNLLHLFQVGARHTGGAPWGPSASVHSKAAAAGCKAQAAARRSAAAGGGTHRRRRLSPAPHARWQLLPPTHTQHTRHTPHTHTPRPPAFACAEQRDYYSNVKTVCADASCNAAQRNLGGSVLVLDTTSYGRKGGQGWNPGSPAACCQACRETDGCNAWVVCRNKVRRRGGWQLWLAALTPRRVWQLSLPGLFGSCR